MTHVPAGRLNGIHAEVGTVLGPKEVTREFVVVIGNDERGVTVGYARREDVGGAAIEAMIERGPQSVAEASMCRGYQAEERAALRRMFGVSR